MVRFPSREQFSEAYDKIKEFDIDISCLQLKTCQQTIRQPILSDAQYEVVKKALDLGYFNVPRDVTVQELANTLGILHQAASERLRRAHKEVFFSLIYDRPHQSAETDYAALQS